MRFGHTTRKTSLRCALGVRAVATVMVVTPLLAACSMPGGNVLNSTGSITPASSGAAQLEAPHLVSFVGERAWPSLRSAMITALHGSEDGERVMWKSSTAGLSGTVTPLTTVTSGDGRRCRRIAITAATQQNANEILSEACPVGTGSWQISPL
jgi:hypothetical protein